MEKRIDREFAEYEDAMLEHSTAYVFAKCGEINAMCTCYNLLTIKLVQAEDIPCIEYLASHSRSSVTSGQSLIASMRRHSA